MYEVGGFAFESEEMAQKAKKEIEGIKYIKSQTRMDDPDVVFDLYNKILQRKMFETQVGVAFLIELQEYLRTIPYIKNEDIRPIPVRTQVSEKDKAKKKTVKTKEKIVVRDDGYKGRYRVCLFVAFIMLFIIVGMFGVVCLSGNNVNIINYENKIINKYEQWETQLKEREIELDEREAEIERGASNGQN